MYGRFSITLQYCNIADAYDNMTNDERKLEWIEKMMIKMNVYKGAQ